MNLESLILMPIGITTSGEALASSTRKDSSIPLDVLTRTLTPLEQTAEDEQHETDDITIDFPEGGLKAWTSVAGSFMGLMNTFGLINSTGAIEAYISKHQLAGVSASVTGWCSRFTYVWHCFLEY